MLRTISNPFLTSSSDFYACVRLQRLARGIFKSEKISVFDESFFACALITTFEVDAVLGRVTHVQVAFVDVDAG